MNTLRASSDFGISIGFQFHARSNDGSLEDTLNQLTALLTTLFTWVQHQLQIAPTAADLIVEARSVLRQLSIALALAIEIMTMLLRVIHWLEDVYLVVTQDIPERWGRFWFNQDWNYKGVI